MLFKEYLAYNKITFQECEQLDPTIPLLKLKFFKSPMNAAMLIILENELFFPTEFRGWSRLDYHLITAEELHLSMTGRSVVPAPKALGLIGYSSSRIQEQERVAFELEHGFAVINQQGWEAYRQLQALTIYPAHEVTWHSEDKSNVLSVFTQRVIQRLPTLVEFPPLPTSAESLLQLKARGGPNIERLIAIIEKDMLLTAQVIMWARSPLYGPKAQVTSVRQAIMYVLGYDLVLNLCLSLTLKRSMHQPMGGILGWEKQGQQAYLTGMLAREIALKKNLPVQLDLVLLSGMLCDIGYFVLGQYFQPHYAVLAEDIEANPKTDPCLIEFNNFHFTHQHLGAWLLKGWNMPYEVITAVQWHHTLQPATFYDDYPYCVFLARYFLSAQGYGDEFKIPRESPDLGLDNQQHNELEETTALLIKKVEGL